MKIQEETNDREGAIEQEDIEVSLQGECSAKEPPEIVQEEGGRGETRQKSSKSLKSCVQLIIIGILTVLLCTVTGLFLLSQQQMGTNLNQTTLQSENSKLMRLLSTALQEKTLLQVENQYLNIILNSTLENVHLVKEEKTELKVLLNQSLHNITVISAESKELRLQLNNEHQISMQLKAQNQHQRSILMSDSLSFLWERCNKITLDCLRCPPGWTEHTNRCFFLSHKALKWEGARRDCLKNGGDLAVVLDAADQAFLTNMTFQFVRQHPQVIFHSAWIGLQDTVMEGEYQWVNGGQIHPDVTYWKSGEPNNAMASWDFSNAGQDCVGIVPPRNTEDEDWLNSWDDIVCAGNRHFLCETLALNLT